ncbi:hypothetical protein CN514_02190 [Bacillus sp. AFS001701]|nr:hypothetical protein CN514_02190 [Bacillus sp. AFS001701]
MAQFIGNGNHLSCFNIFEVIWLKTYSIDEFVRNLGRAEQTLRNLDNTIKIEPYRVSVGGTQYNSQEQLNYYFLLKIFNSIRIFT